MSPDLRSKSRVTIFLAICAAVLSGKAIAEARYVRASAFETSTKSASESDKVESRRTVHAVRRALEHTPGITTSDITVLARAGTVTLLGSVPDQNQIIHAEAVAASVPNVQSVNNQLTVRPLGY